MGSGKEMGALMHEEMICTIPTCPYAERRHYHIIMNGIGERELREDVPTPCLSQAEALAMAPKTEHGYFVVPHMMDD